jgi:recombination protein U
MRAVGYANRGAALEQIIITANSRYADQGVAVIDKQYTHWMPIRNGQGKIVSAKVEHKATVDFRGTVKDLGGVSFDVKETRADRWYLRDLQPHQVEHLKKCQAVGDICFTLIAFWKHDCFSILYLDEYLSLIRQGTKSLRADHIRTFPVGKLWDYLLFIRKECTHGSNCYKTRDRTVPESHV